MGGNVDAAKLTISRARALRRTMTAPELRLWAVLRDSQAGLKVRRQHPFGPYILDFYCARARLAVEVDGEGHALGNQPAHDQRRDVWLARHGVATLRFAANDIRDNLEGVVQAIVIAAAAR